MVNVIINNIQHNDKRMQKLNGMTAYKAREQAARYVIAEAAALKVKLSDDQIRHAAITIVG